MAAEVSRGNTATGTETISELLDSFLEHAVNKGLSPNTLRGYRQITRTVVRPELGKLKLSRLTARDLERLYAQLRAKGNSATTVRHVRTLIGTTLHQAERWNMVDRNVARQAIPTAVHAKEVVAS